jgi:hypothetical protein
MAVIALAVISPFICLSLYGYLPSISSYWRTGLQPLFIIANATTSYYLYSVKRWRIPALFLLLLTSFSVELYPTFHNILAVGFFISNIIPLLKTNRFKWTIYPYASSLLILPFSMTFAEIIAIISLCIYHALILKRYMDIYKS